MKQTNTIQCLNFSNIKDAAFLEENAQLLAVPNKLSFFYLKEDTLENRILLRKLINTNDKEHFVVVSANKEVAFLAWKANVLAFMYYQKEVAVGFYEFLIRLKKYPPIKEEVKEKLKISFKGGFELVAIASICFCVGSGNYTYIYLENGTRKCISYPLNVLEKRIKEVPFLNRIGKSFIVNINRIKKVQSQHLVFKGATEIELKLGDIYIKRVKQNLLWY
jgi:DNA-binding LytR/AlgR family response regulator|tara:strand:+ start:25 stop:684 length:660 start_codon:yes stop_codon:yes gene_type:complete